MPQEIRVVKCYKCNTFQVDIVKKAKRWECKLCGEKQSVLQEFGRGSGKTCREHAQKLNENKFKTEAEILEIALNNTEENSNEKKIESEFPSRDTDIVQRPISTSKWTAFVEKDSEDENLLFGQDSEVSPYNAFIAKNKNENHFDQNPKFLPCSTVVKNKVNTYKKPIKRLSTNEDRQPLSSKKMIQNKNNSKQKSTFKLFDFNKKPPGEHNRSSKTEILSEEVKEQFEAVSSPILKTSKESSPVLKTNVQINGNHQKKNKWDEYISETKNNSSDDELQNTNICC